MSGQVILSVTLELLSDTVFGSGFSVPGGEDVAVCQDGEGYPYLKGSTFKGLLRESITNLLAWTGGDKKTVNELLGEEGWEGLTDGRRIRLTDLVLPQSVRRSRTPEECFDTRVQTALENGVVREKTLRTVSCICRGLKFIGEVSCRREDAALLRDALRGIKWAGTMRSRGFGRVSIHSEQVEQTEKSAPLPETPCIHYRLHTLLPVLATDLSRSYGNGYETRGYLPGASVRGMVMSTLVALEPEWFAEHKTQLLSAQTRFLDAVPNPTQTAAIPSIRGFYEDKEERRFESVLPNGVFTPGLKRAKLGTFCAPEGDTVRYWHGESGGVTRIQRNVGKEEDTMPFQTRYLSAGQDFEGYILLEDATLAPVLARAFSKTVWLGADRYEGFGKCEVRVLEAVDRPKWSKYGYQTRDEVGNTLYLLALSPLTMLNSWGEPCGLGLSEEKDTDEAGLAQMLGVSSVKMVFCSTALSEYGGYNRTWKCRAPAVRMYDRGSIFKLECDRPPELEKLREIEWSGLGIRTAEGFGQVLFLSPRLFEGLRRKEAVERAVTHAPSAAARERRAKYLWVEEQAKTLQYSKLSPSQFGSIQALCEKAIAAHGDTGELETFLKKNREERGAEHGSRFEKMDDFLETVLEKSLEQTLGVPCDDSKVKRLELLCLLFDYNRKGKREEEN